jgi:hypothetical protein
VEGTKHDTQALENHIFLLLLLPAAVRCQV